MTDEVAERHAALLVMFASARSRGLPPIPSTFATPETPLPPCADRRQVILKLICGCEVVKLFCERAGDIPVQHAACVRCQEDPSWLPSRLAKSGLA